MSGGPPVVDGSLTVEAEVQLALVGNTLACQVHAHPDLAARYALAEATASGVS